MTDLFSPVRLGPCRLDNRIVMAPMTRNRASDSFVPQPIAATYYGQRAAAGLIITEGAQVSPEAAGYPRTPGIYDDAQVDGWRVVTRAVHERGGRIFLQLWHAGRISHPLVQPAGAAPVAPSAIQAAGTLTTPAGIRPYVVPRALATDEVPGIVAQFRHGARCALAAEFDGVELHAANGYLLDQFLRSGSNRRSDRYGGSIENRTRLLLEVTEAVIEVWGEGRVGVHLSPLVDVHDVHDDDPEALFGNVAEALGHHRLAYLHVFETIVPHPQTPSRTFDVRALRRTYPGTYIANGGYDLRRANAAIEASEADLVSFGRPFIANPDLPQRWRTGAPLAVADPATFYQGGPRGYTDYPPLRPTDGRDQDAGPADLRRHS